MSCPKHEGRKAGSHLPFFADPVRVRLDRIEERGTLGSVPVRFPFRRSAFDLVTVGHPSVTVWMTRPVTGGPSKLDTLGAALWAEDSGGRELEDPGSLAKVRGALQDAGAPEGELFYRRENEHYGQAAERAAADIIVEDDCESIDGPAQMTYPKLGPDSKARTKSVVIPEWGGIDHLPTDPEKLRTY